MDFLEVVLFWMAHAAHAHAEGGGSAGILPGVIFLLQLLHAGFNTRIIFHPPALWPGNVFVVRKTGMIRLDLLCTHPFHRGHRIHPLNSKQQKSKKKDGRLRRVWCPGPRC
jgi:hypothetical protein